METIHEGLQATLDKAVDDFKIFGTSFCIQYKEQYWLGASGNFSPHSQYFIASTTKLFITAIILHLEANGKITLEDKITRYLNSEITDNLHYYKGHDYSNELTITHLLAHTSGLPDYFAQEDESQVSLRYEMLHGKDEGWTFHQAIESSKNLTPLFKPGCKNKAHYSDTNFQLLGKIIEVVTQKSLHENLEQIIVKPLGLEKTYLYRKTCDNRPEGLYFENKELHIPRSMVSFWADGAIVSTSHETMIFLKAFANGKFFPQSTLSKLYQWNKIFFPMESGIGIHRFKMPWFLDPLRRTPVLFGHAGLSGALAYFNPDLDLYITGTINQMAYPQESFALAAKLIRKTLSLG